MLPLVEIVAQILGLTFSFALPGVLFVAPVPAPWSAPVRALVGACLGMLAMPMVCFCVAWALHTSVTLPLVLASGAVANVAGAALLIFRRRRRAS